MLRWGIKPDELGFEQAKDPLAELRALADPANADLLAIKERLKGGTTVNVNPTNHGLPQVPPGFFRPDPTRPGVVPEPGTRSPGQLETDKAFAPIYAEWSLRGGYGDVQKQLDDLRWASQELAKGGVTGPGAIISRSETAGPILQGRTVAVRDRILQSAQRNLRLVLGPQFTAKEGEALLSRVFNPLLPDAENKARVDSLIQQIETAAKEQQAAADFFEANGTLQGYTPQQGAGTLPPGIPPGSRMIGTSGGKPVYETPDGQRLIVE